MSVMNAVLCFIMQYINEISNEGKKPVGKKCLHADYCVKFIQMTQILCFYELNTSKCTVWMFLTCKIQQLIKEIMCKVPGILEIFVSNAWSCNVTLECRLCIENHAVFDALGTRRSFHSRRVVSDVEAAKVLAKWTHPTPILE